MSDVASSAESDVVRVLIADDQALLREGIATILSVSERIEVVGQAASGEAALTQARALRPDVVLMDVEMPGMGGLEAARLLVADPDVASRVLILTTFDREDYLLAALRAGASGFLLKNARPEQLVDAVRAVAAGDALLSPEVTRAVIERAVARSMPAAYQSGVRSTGTGTGPDAGTDDLGLLAVGAGEGAAAHGLTERERDVLALLAQGLSNEEIATRLFVGRATVKTHVSNVLLKLALRDRVQAVAYAYQHGLVAAEPPAAPPGRGTGWPTP